MDKRWKRNRKFRNIEFKNFIDILKLNKIDILDVRRESEFKNKHIEGAKNIPLSNLKDKAQILDKVIIYTFTVQQDTDL